MAEQHWIRTAAPATVLRAAAASGVDPAAVLRRLVGEDFRPLNITFRPSAPRSVHRPSRAASWGGDRALTSEEQAGYEFFSGNCALCHDGPGVGGRRFEKLGEQIAWPANRFPHSLRMMGPIRSPS